MDECKPLLAGADGERRQSVARSPPIGRGFACFAVTDTPIAPYQQRHNWGWW